MKNLVRKIIDDIREKNFKFFSLLRTVYGMTFGFHWFKNIYAKYFGFYNGERRMKLKSHEESDYNIYSWISNGIPFALARYGSIEFRNLTGDKDFNLLCFHAGFFPNDKNFLKKFREVYFHSSKKLDFLAVWNYQNHFLQKIKWLRNFPNLRFLVPLSVAAGPNKKNTWEKGLKGKKILVVHPFKKTIESQYKKGNTFFPNFESFEVIRAVQTIAGNKDKRFETWFNALGYMKSQIYKRDFDIALIGCGAYGLPLAAYVKNIGKQALHLGGGLQLYFKIKGKRWENSKTINIYESDWIHAFEEDKPENFQKIEGGAYW